MKNLEIDRRSFAIGVGKVIGISAFSVWPLLSCAELEEYKPVFLDLSRELTGYQDLDASLASVFYEELQQHYGDDFLQLLKTYKNMGSAKINEKSGLIKKLIIDDTNLKPVSGDLIKLWYTGHTEHSSMTKGQRASAYLKSFQWKVAGKPPGVSSGPTWHLPV